MAAPPLPGAAEGTAEEEAPSLAEEAKKHGGKLNMEQLMRLAGHDV